MLMFMFVVNMMLILFVVVCSLVFCLVVKLVVLIMSFMLWCSVAVIWVIVFFGCVKLIRYLVCVNMVLRLLVSLILVFLLRNVLVFWLRNGELVWLSVLMSCVLVLLRMVLISIWFIWFDVLVIVIFMVFYMIGLKVGGVCCFVFVCWLFIVLVW